MSGFFFYIPIPELEKLASTMSGAVGHKRISKETISNLQIVHQP